MCDFRSACLAVLLVSVHVCAAQQRPTSEPAASPIPESKIAALEAKLAQREKGASSVRRRMACRRMIRQGEALLEASPAAPNRYRVLGIVFQSQKRLLGMENSDRNRNALFDTCGKLAGAPDEYAELRLEADMFLSEKALAHKNADLEERARALAELIKRYRGTPAEAKSLLMAAMIAPKLKASSLERAILDALDERFPGDPDVIEFRRKHLGIRTLDVLLTGTYTRADGVSLRFPTDWMGHHCIMVFWSRETPGFETYLKQIKELQVRYPDRFDVFSFNLDELPDAGEATLHALELDWTVMRLPGGRRSKAYRTYARNDPAGILVNAYGHALLASQYAHGRAFKIRDDRISDQRYLTQLQSLFIGDFLVTEPYGLLDPALPPELKMVSMDSDKDSGTRLNRTAESVPAETLRAIQACFIVPPLRYRLTRAEALANYRKAENLCCEAVKRFPKAPNLWIVRNRGIIALLGMWNQAGEPKYLEHAVQEARASLATELPPGADVVPLFCLAKEAIRRGDAVSESAPSTLIEKTGGDHAPASALAAAAILAVDVNQQDLHAAYRGRLLKDPYGGNPMLWSVTSFLRDRHHTYHLFRANYIIHERGGGLPRSYIINHGAATTRDRLPTLKLKTLDGRTLTLPRDTDGKLTLLVFIELSADTDAEFPIEAKGEPTEKKRSHSVIGFASKLADSHIHKEINLIAAFLSDDADRIGALMKTKALTCRAAMVPGGIRNPLVQRLGILSADRIPNVFLLRRDGTIVWQASGLPYSDSTYVFLLAMKVHIEVCEMETAYKALKQGEFQKAARIFSGPFLPAYPDRYGWRPPRYHGQALAYMGLKDWEAALESIDKAIDAKKLQYFQGRRNKNPAYWRKEAATVTVNQPDDIVVELWATKAVILDKLGRKEEAAEMHRRSEEPVRIESSSIYKLFHERLKNWRLANRREIVKP